MSALSNRRRWAAVTATATVLTGCIAIGFGPIAAEATTKVDLLSPVPAGSEDFGGDVLVLSNGNYVVVDAFFDSGAAVDAGAVYLYNGANNQLISTVTGSTAGDQIGLDGVTEVGTSDFVILSGSWHDGLDAVGAMTWVNGTTGLNGQVTTGNSLVGSQGGDLANSDVIALANGNFVVASPDWDNAGTVDVGAVTWVSGATGRAGQKIQATNSLIGTATDDRIGGGGVTPLTNDTYVVSSPNWDGAGVDLGAVTWIDGAVTSAAVVTTTNSLVGASAGDGVGSGGVTALTNGNYVVSSPAWDGGVTVDAGAVTWASGVVNTHATVSSVNSLIGTTDSDHVGGGGVTALANGDYVVSSPDWDNSTTFDVGAVTQVDGTGPTAGVVSVTNSLFGNVDLDNVASGGVTALANGNYVVSSPFFSTLAAVEAGAVTWVDGTIGAVGPVDEASSLVGASALDHVGSGGVTALTDGDYVVSSPVWDNGPNADVGAVTWAVGNAATLGIVAAANSLIGTTVEDPGGLRTADNVGSGGVTALTDGNYVVSSPLWNGPVDGAGAVTWLSGTGATSGTVSVANSLVGTILDDNVGSAGVKALVVPSATVGSYVVVSDRWDSSGVEAAIDAGAATFAPSGGIVGPITPLNSAIGTPGALLGDVLSASDRLTSDNTIVVATAQNRVLLLRLDDLVPPVLGPVPANITTTNTSGTAGRLVTFVTPSATDNRGVPSVECSPASGSTFLIGVTTVTCTATDGAGLTDVDTFTVTVNDVDPPVLAHHDNVGINVSPGVTTRAVTFALPTATDNDHVQSVVCDRASGSLFPVGVTTVTCTATDDSGLTDSGTFTVTVTVETSPGNPPGNPPGVPAASTYTALSGARLADTRPGQPTVDSLFAGQGIRGAGSTWELTVAGRGGVAADAVAVALNVTAVGGNGNGYVTVYPCGSDRPTASNLNFTTGAVIPNAVIAKIGAGGKVCLFTSAATHLVVDVSGYFPLGTSLRSLNPARMLDTRNGQPTFDGQQQGIGGISGGSVTPVRITGRASVSNDASAVVLNVTVTDPRAPGFVTVFPCGAAVPNASNLNFVAGATVANLMASKIGDNGAVCVYTSQPTDLIVDVAGFFPAGSLFNSLIPARLLDTRVPGATIDGLSLGGGAREAGEITELSVLDRGGVPAGARTVVLNVTATEPTAAGFVTVYPCGVPTPLASNLNFEAGTTAANAVIVKVGTDGKVCLFNSRSTQLIVDVDGFFTSG